ncbi:MAG: type IV pilus biogenesis protein PilM [Methyloprofundus sp.]|nr:type IV pilus biogenesis protein PilM [Methyloprofundus sp.]
MWPTAFLAMFIATVTIIGIKQTTEMRSLNQATVDNTMVSSLLSYRKAVIDYVADHPGVVGEVSDAALAPYYPYGYVNPGLWGNLVSNERLYVFTDQRISTDILDQRLYRSLLVGQNINGQLVSISGQQTLISLPAIIPANAIVIVGY